MSAPPCSRTWASWGGGSTLRFRPWLSLPAGARRPFKIKTVRRFLSNAGESNASQAPGDGLGVNEQGGRARLQRKCGAPPLKRTDPPKPSVLTLRLHNPHPTRAQVGDLDPEVIEVIESEDEDEAADDDELPQLVDESEDEDGAANDDELPQLVDSLGDEGGGEGDGSVWCLEHQHRGALHAHVVAWNAHSSCGRDIWYVAVRPSASGACGLGLGTV